MFLWNLYLLALQILSNLVVIIVDVLLDPIHQKPFLPLVHFLDIFERGLESLVIEDGHEPHVVLSQLEICVFHPDFGAFEVGAHCINSSLENTTRVREQRYSLVLSTC